MNDIRNHWGMGNYIFSKEAEERLNRLSPMEFQHIFLFLRKLVAGGPSNRYQTLPNGLVKIEIDNTDFRLIAKFAGNKIQILKFYRKAEEDAKIIGAGAGAAFGAAVGGPLGAAIGGLLGWVIGNEANKPK